MRRRMKLNLISRLLSGPLKDLYFSYNRFAWTDDATSGVVQLRDRIVDLIEGRTDLVTGNTTKGERYIFAKADGRYALIRIVNERFAEGTYFQRGWPYKHGEGSNLAIQPLEIRGMPYIIVMKPNATLQTVP